MVHDGRMLKHREGCLQKVLPVLDAHPLVVVMAVQQWRRVRRNIRQSLVMQGVFVKFDLLIDAGSCSWKTRVKR